MGFSDRFSLKCQRFRQCHSSWKIEELSHLGTLELKIRNYINSFARFFFYVMRLFRWFFTSVKSTSSFLISFLIFIQLLFFFLPCRNSLVVVVSFNKDETRCEISQIPRLTPQLYFMARKLMWDTKQEKEKKVLLSKIENCRLALSLSLGRNLFAAFARQ